jgi:DNA-binding response OmpR family regulator
MCQSENSIYSVFARISRKIYRNIKSVCREKFLRDIWKGEKSNFDLVITDLQMPGIDGNGVVRHIRNSKRRTTPVVGLSGTPWLLEQSNFDAILQKPTSIKTLVATVKSIARSN